MHVFRSLFAERVVAVAEHWHQFAVMNPPWFLHLLGCVLAVRIVECHFNLFMDETETRRLLGRFIVVWYVFQCQPACSSFREHLAFNTPKKTSNGCEQHLLWMTMKQKNRTTSSASCLIMTMSIKTTASTLTKLFKAEFLVLSLIAEKNCVEMKTFQSSK